MRLQYNWARRPKIIGTSVDTRACGVLLNAINPENKYINPCELIQQQHNQSKSESNQITENHFIEKSTEISVYPNPTNEELFIEYAVEGVCKLLIVDQFGKVQLEKELTRKQRFNKIPVANLSAGIYYYQLVQNNQIVTTDKLVIIK